MTKKYTNECMRKFGVKVLTGANLDSICKDCGLRLGLHSGFKCPTNNEPDHDLEYHDKKCEEVNEK